MATPIRHEQVATITEAILERVQSIPGLEFANLEWDDDHKINWISCRTFNGSNLDNIKAALALFNLRVSPDTDLEDDFTYFTVTFPKVGDADRHVIDLNSFNHDIRPRILELVDMATTLGDIHKIVFYYNDTLYQHILEFRMWYADDTDGDPAVRFGTVPSYTAARKVTMTWHGDGWSIIQDF